MSSSEQTSSKCNQIKKERLMSLDALRGFDLLFLVGIGPIFSAFRGGPFREFFATNDWGKFIVEQFNHVAWEGFVCWDLIMPLFLFTTGITIPFQFAKYFNNGSHKSWLKIYLRIFKRVLLLWIFGMIAQGHLLDLKLNGLYLYSNTLQAIAVGYLIASVLYLHFGITVQIVVFLLLLIGYWGASTYIQVENYGCNFVAGTTLAEWIDIKLLGQFQGSVSFNNGTWAISSNYHYTWILSSLTFGATVISGVFAGELIRRNSLSRKGSSSNQEEEGGKKEFSGHTVFALLLLMGVAFIALGWFWGKVPENVFGYCPIIKPIWTPSMVLFSSGWSIILLALFYEIIDVLGFKWGSAFLIVLGMNSITAYMLPRFINFSSMVKGIIYGTQQYLQIWYEPAVAIFGFLLLWYILWCMYRCGKFLRV